ncbi:MAG: hypothetical protein VX899_13745 [Myxococcota bacterium]|nr:hypothetical protein [Myxococcota bacterium]
MQHRTGTRATLAASLGALTILAGAITGAARATEIPSADPLLSGLAFSFGHGGMARDYARGKELLEQACLDGESLACGSWQWRDPAGPSTQAVVAHFEPACLEGAPVACLPAAWALLDPSVGAPQPDRAKALLERACEGGLPQGCTELALAGLSEQVQVEEAQSWALLESACTAQDGAACATLAEHRPADEAMLLAQTACALESSRGCAVLAELQLGAQQIEQGLALHQAACEAGYLGSCQALGERYRRGQDVKQSPKTALRLFESGCRGGLADACEEAGEMLLAGAQVPPDPQAGWAYIHQGCLLGDQALCHAVIEDARPQDLSGPALLQVGQRLTQDCSEGDDAACGTLGLATVFGAGVHQDIAWGLQIMARSCAAGDPISCYDLARLEDQGVLDRENPRAARVWYGRACTLGHAPSCAALPRRLRPVADTARLE